VKEAVWQWLASEMDIVSFLAICLAGGIAGGMSGNWARRKFNNQHLPYEDAVRILKASK